MVPKAAGLTIRRRQAALATVDMRNHDSAALFPDRGCDLGKGGNMRNALTIAALVLALAACRAHGGLSVGDSGQQPVHVASAAE